MYRMPQSVLSSLFVGLERKVTCLLRSLHSQGSSQRLRSTRWTSEGSAACTLSLPYLHPDSLPSLRHQLSLMGSWGGLTDLSAFDLQGTSHIILNSSSSKSVSLHTYLVSLPVEGDMASTYPMAVMRIKGHQGCGAAGT